MIKGKLSPAIQLSLTFLLFGCIWIMLTDYVSLGIADNNLPFLSRVQTYKGIFFILMSAMLIYAVSNKLFLRQKALQQQLTEERVKYRNELAQEIFNAQEAERKKLGEELHDNINQLLGVVKLYIEHAQVNPSSMEEMLRKSSTYLVQVITEIRQLSRTLVSPTMSELGLRESIQDLIQSILDTKKMNIRLDDEAFSEEILPDIKKLMVYRILQEQFNNILKHSQASQVDVQLKRYNQTVYLTVADNGVGFDMKTVRHGLGLQNISHRLELFNGKLKVDSTPGSGCRLEAVFEI